MLRNFALRAMRPDDFVGMTKMTEMTRRYGRGLFAEATSRSWLDGASMTYVHFDLGGLIR